MPPVWVAHCSRFPPAGSRSLIFQLSTGQGDWPIFERCLLLNVTVMLSSAGYPDYERPTKRADSGLWFHRLPVGQTVIGCDSEHNCPYYLIWHFTFWWSPEIGVYVSEVLTWWTVLYLPLEFLSMTIHQFALRATWQECLWGALCTKHLGQRWACPFLEV